MQHTFEFPATQGIQAGRRFYTVTAPISVLHRLITIDTKAGIMNRSQRDVEALRAKKLAKYVEENPNSWVLPSLTGAIDEAPEFSEWMNTGVGILKISMGSVIKLFDGQHRAVGLMEVATGHPDLRHNSVSIQIYVGMSLEERQQAFTDINMNAKAVSKGLSMVYNHRDEANRAIADEVLKVDAWKGHIEWQKSSCSGASDKLFPFKAIVEAVYIYTGATKKEPPTNEQIADAVAFFNEISAVTGWSESKGSDGESMKYYREAMITYHAVGLKALALYGYQAKQAGLDAEEAADKLQALEGKFERMNEVDWEQRCVDFEGKMKSGKDAVIDTAKRMIDKAGVPSDGLSW